MPDLLIHFPPEIVINIISYISQSDCIECLQVCNRWHHEIPAYSQQVWRQLNVHTAKFYVNDCIMKCLPHVQKVTFEFHPYVIVKRLADLTCNITFLELGGHMMYNVPLTPNLVDIVSPVQNTLTELIVNEFTQDISLTDALRSLPKLTHLTFRSEDNYGFSSNLVYFCMEAGHMCPNLRALVVFIGYAKLRYLLWDVELSNMYRQYDELLDRWKVASKSPIYDDQIGTLREVVYANNGHLNETIVPLLLRSQQYLVYADFCPLAYSAFPDFIPQAIEIANLRLSKVKHVALTRLEDDQTEWIDFIFGCGQLKSLELGTRSKGSLLYKLVEAISAPESLQSLTIQGDHDDCSKYPGSIGCILQRFSTLQCLEIYNLYLSDQDLVDICGMQSLQSLILGFSYRCKNPSLEALLKATKKLQLTNTQIRVLKLVNAENVTDAVLEGLGQIKNLSELHVRYNLLLYIAAADLRESLFS